jgi:uncharacterized protein
MNKLENRIREDLREAMKNKDDGRVSTLRMIIASMQNAVIEKKQDKLNDDDISAIISRQLKQRAESIESFKKAGRNDLVEKESAESGILKQYLPPQADTAEIERIVREVISQTGAASKSDFGMVIKLCMQKLKGRADGKNVSSIVQKLL